MQYEFPLILKAEQQKELTLFWIALSASMYDITELVHYQALNSPSTPLDHLSSAAQNKELARIGKQIQYILCSSNTYAKAETQEFIPIQHPPQTPSPTSLSHNISMLSPTDKRTLAQLLITCPCMANIDPRKSIVGQLPDNIRYARIRDARQDIDVQNIVDCCNNYAGGVQTLITTVLSFDDGTWQAQELTEWLHRLVQ